MNPARTREDVLSWLTMDEVQAEVFGAFVGAQQHTRKFDFATYHADGSDNDPGYQLQDGTVLFVDGEPAWSRAQFLEYLVAGIAWRLEALAKRKGVDLTHYNIAESVLGPIHRPTVEEKLQDSFFSYLGGEVLTMTDEQMEALPDAQRKALKSGKPVVLPEGAL